MPAVEALCHLFGINPSKLTKHENLLLEAELFTRLCDKLQENFKQQYKEYFQLMKFSLEMEDLYGYLYNTRTISNYSTASV